MSNANLNEPMRRLVRERLTLTAEEKTDISKIYSSVQRCLGSSNCIQIGSYARFTAIRPPHDLDVLYVLGPRPPQVPDPSRVLGRLLDKVKSEFSAPARYTATFELQTHSVTIKLASGDLELFSVDIVPAYEDVTNEFGDPTYFVPEIIRSSHIARRELERAARGSGHSISLIRSDPRGYTTVASQVNDSNSDFRRAVKFAKGWRAACKLRNPKFALKSFHAEQVLTSYFRANPTLEIADAVLRFFRDLPAIMARPQIVDRADANVFIDEYLLKLTAAQRSEVVEAGRVFLQQFDRPGSIEGIDRSLSGSVSTANQVRAARPGAPSIVVRSPTVITNPAQPWSR